MAIHLFGAALQLCAKEVQTATFCARQALAALLWKFVIWYAVFALQWKRALVMFVMYRYGLKHVVSAKFHGPRLHTRKNTLALIHIYLPDSQVAGTCVNTPSSTLRIPPQIRFRRQHCEMLLVQL